MNSKLVLISRFNLPHPVWKERTKEAYEAWIKDRVNLFRDYTASSVRNCYDKPDLWLVLVDNSVVNVTDALTEVTKGLPVKFVQYNGKKIVPSIQEALSDFEFPMRITTCRADTDDVLASGIFKGYRSAKITDEQAREGVTLSFSGGATYNSANDTFYLSSYPENPFLAYVEEVDSAQDMRTVYMSQHTEMMNDSKHSLSLRSFGPQWASVVHDDNLGNHSLLNIAHYAFADTEKLKKSFGMK